MSEGWEIVAVKVDQRYGVSVPARWTVELESWHDTQPPIGKVVVEHPSMVYSRPDPVQEER